MLAKRVAVCVTLLAGAMLGLSVNTANAAVSGYEAETSPAVCTGTIDSNWSGYTGTGFCNGNNAVGAYAQFTVNAARSGRATVGVRFANGTTTARPVNLVVNGSTVDTPSFEPTGSWSTWVTKILTVTLSAGTNTIKLDPTTTAGLANIDYLTVDPSGLPASFQWSSSSQLIAPKSDSTHTLTAVKDPSIVYYNGKYHVFVSSVNQNGSYNLAYLNFTDFSQAGSAQQYYLDSSGIGSAYRAAPQVFYFAPQQRWYLVYQTGNMASYSTTTDISNPKSWSAPTNFFSSTPQIVTDNRGSGQWLDFWVICDSAKCYLFSSDDNGHQYRSETTVADFPNGFTNTTIYMQDSSKTWLFEASNVYKIDGTNTYLLMVEAIGEGRRMFRSWTAPALTGPWSPLADTKTNPFARSTNVTFESTAWTHDFSHGELIRSGIDQTLTVSPCNVRFLYQGMDPSSSGSYNLLPWRLGLLTQTNSTC